MIGFCPRCDTFHLPARGYGARKAEWLMSLWQRLGALVGSLSRRTGAVAGSVASVLDPDNWLPGGRDAAFTLALIALSAKMAVSDGVVTASELRAFKKTVDIPSGHTEQVDTLFRMAQRDVAGFETYARKIGRFFRDTPETLEHVLDGLFHIAAADGFIHEAELEYLRTVGTIFGFDETRFEQIAAQHVVLDTGSDPYIVLGLAPTAERDEVRRVYRRLVAEHHPDRLIARGVPEELLDLATARMAAINAAYSRIMRQAPALPSPGQL